MSQSKFRVSDKATMGLFLRSEPVVKESTKITVLSMGHLVTKVADSSVTGWWEVSTTVEGTSVSGFVSSRFLVPDSDFEGPETVSSITAVHLPHLPGMRVTRNGTQQAYPLNEAGQPTRRSSSSNAEKAKELTEIIRWLDVENKDRYRPLSSSTYCNIYAYDYNYLGGVYVPRVWWTHSALVKLRAGRAVRPVYAETVVELNANSLFDWFRDFGSTFGWKRTFDLTEMQNAANDGQAVIISAQHKRPNKSGHICPVVPETASKKAERSGSKVVRPLQSQAGRTNRKYQTSIWWTMNIYRNFGFWINAS